VPTDVKIIVTDTPPLITLAAAKSLDYLLYPKVAGVPDAGFAKRPAEPGLAGRRQATAPAPARFPLPAARQSAPASAGTGRKVRRCAGSAAASRCF
jgi:hypothetical protein